MRPLHYWWKLVRGRAALLGVGYVCLALLAPVIAEHSLYYPQLGSHRPPAGGRKIRGPDGAEIAVLHLPNPAAQFTIWFFHGNAEDLGDDEPFLHALRDQGFAVFAFDYPGYGHSAGKPSEASLHAATRVARRYLRDSLGVTASRTIIMGRSLGGGPAVQAALDETPGGLVLQSAFTSVFRVVTRWRLLPFDEFENLRKIPGVKCPVLVMHGRADGVIPFRHGEALFAAAPEPKRCLWVAGANHNDFIEVAGPRFGDALRDFSALCARAAGANP